MAGSNFSKARPVAMNAAEKARRRPLPAVKPPAPLQLANGVSVDASVLAEMMRGVVLEFAESLPHQVDPQQRERLRVNRGRQYALRLRDRMKKFRSVYNKAWFVRHAEMQEREYREQKMREFWDSCRKELEDCKDIEAFTYAVSDALTSYRYGFPWEG